MSVIDLDVAKEHARIFSDDEDATIQLYLNAAERSAARYMQRQFFADPVALGQAKTEAVTVLRAVLVDLRTREGAAEAIEDAEERSAALDAIQLDREAARSAFASTMAGLVMDDDVKAACLLTFGHLYENRETNVVAPGITVAVDLPFGARALLQPHRVGLGI